MGRGRRVTHPLTTQARAPSAQYWVLELSDACWRRGWGQHQLQDQEAGRPALTTQAGWLSPGSAAERSSRRRHEGRPRDRDYTGELVL